MSDSSRSNADDLVQIKILKINVVVKYLAANIVWPILYSGPKERPFKSRQISTLTVVFFGVHNFSL